MLGICFYNSFHYAVVVLKVGFDDKKEKSAHWM